MGFLSGELLSGLAGEVTGEKYSVSYPFGGRFENVLSIEEIGSDKIVLCVKKGRLVISGEDLGIYAYCGGDVTVKGKIFLVERV